MFKTVQAARVALAYLSRNRKPANRNVMPKRRVLDESDGEDDSGADILGDKLRSIVKIFATCSEPCYARPWSMREQKQSVGLKT